MKTRPKIFGMGFLVDIKQRNYEINKYSNGEWNIAKSKGTTQREFYNYLFLLIAN